MDFADISSSVSCGGVNVWFQFHFGTVGAISALTGRNSMSTYFKFEVVKLADSRAILPVTV